MKKYTAILLIILAVFQACKKYPKVQKDALGYYPKVKTLSAEKQLDGSVIVTGQVIATGSAPIQYAGICMDTLPDPQLDYNQVIATDVNSGIFKCTYSSFDATKTYYFRAWVANDFGYGIGDDIYVRDIKFDSSLIPCHPQLQYMHLTGIVTVNEKYSGIAPISSSTTLVNCLAVTSGHSLEINFSRVPVQGVYAISNADEPGNTSVTVSVDHMRSDGNSSLYVRQLTATTFELSICDLSVHANLGTMGQVDQFTLSTRLNVTVAP